LEKEKEEEEEDKKKRKKKKKNVVCGWSASGRGDADWFFALP
jgi:hypothetical protein